MLENRILLSVIFLLVLTQITLTLQEVYTNSSSDQNLFGEYNTAVYNFTIRLINLLDINDKPALTLIILFPNNTESPVFVKNSYNFTDHSQGLYLIKPSNNYILTNTSYFYINKNNQTINIGYIDYSKLIVKINDQNRTIGSLEREIGKLKSDYEKLGNYTAIRRLENRIAELRSDYDQLKNDIVRNFYPIILNMKQLNILIYVALTIAIIVIIFTAVYTRTVLRRLKNIEEYIKIIKEDTEIE